METAHNLKRRRDSGEGQAKKLCLNTPLQNDPPKEKCSQSPAPTSTPTTTSRTPPQARNQSTTNPSNQSFSYPAWAFPLSYRSFFFFTRTFLPFTVQGSHYAKPFNSNELWKLAQNKIGLAGWKQSTNSNGSSSVFYGAGDHFGFPAQKEAEATARLRKIKKKVSNPFNFRGTHIVTTFICSADSRTQGVWRYLEKASQTDAGVRLVELEQPSLKKNVETLCGKGPDLRSPFISQISKSVIPHGCWRSVQRWLSYHWPRHRLTKASRWHPHPRRFSVHSR